MKILFVCHSNIGRSQIAKAFYNRLTNTNDAEAAGVSVKEVGQTLLERKEVSESKHFFLLDVMNDIGYDLSNAKRELLDKDVLSRYDKVISMETKESSPSWLLEAPNYVYWNIMDPRGQDYETTARVRDEILAKVEELIQSEK